MKKSINIEKILYRTYDFSNVVRLKGDIDLICSEILSPKMKKINASLEQENDIRFIAHGLVICIALGYNPYPGSRRNMDIPIPSLEEQKKVVKQLDLINQIVKKTEKQLQHLKELAMSLFVKLYKEKENEKESTESL